uniref:RING-type E3 ubiquitin transferase n=1 Tax=Ananas comosus var. bracteatus TaxID=296719 RepID=A0A6V7QY64_ANACO
MMYKQYNSNSSLEGEEDEEARLESVDPLPFRRTRDGDPFFPVFSADPYESESDSDYSDRHAPLSLDLFNRRCPFPHIAMDPFPNPTTRGNSFASESIEFSRSRPVDSEGLRIAAFDSDSDSDGQIVAIGADSDSESIEDRDAMPVDLGIPLCWDCLQIEDQRRDPNEDFEWEEVDGRVDERDVLSITIVGNGSGSDEVGELDQEDADLEEDAVRNLEWEVLLAVNSMGRNPRDPDDVEAYFVDDHEGFVYASDYEAYEVLFGQFVGHDSPAKGSPPAAKSAVESLPSVVLAEEDLAKDGIQCAVCKDGILVDERVKQLPCSHHFHEECILPWLGMRNTCPLCRYELPTDDPEYEKWKARSASGNAPQDEFSVLV